MECKECHKLISREIDGEISEDDSKKLKMHLNQCQECSRLRASLASISEFHKGIEEVEPPSTLLEGIMSGIREEDHLFQLGLWAKLAVSAAAVFVMLAGAGVGNFLAERSVPRVDPLEDDIFRVEYLANYPPGSTGQLIAALTEGGEYEQE
ncbi:MAG: zf-HC2 domain-containing protein [Candidatus Krumholzibacteriota bacterium]|nr:zf-HC2 domain-containing protein [Candidatus Krumholzibacteriota bacterium]